ncbi:MAG TPA: Hsp20/alpha crystallin family protein [bacterium]|nr:Hsp20/alpha crystallin family protein [bacterium]HNZ73409.1 Hsp20/alpha crystallin family protein [bacterium]HOH67298.1 Hsp20/alpha crystallin family protein [bacterium]HPN81362.1 Hsp20/alpha crystallin family protein [bacterium]HPW39330.1 Hsp20/alpha crystallin family protein [bacterium]
MAKTKITNSAKLNFKKDTRSPDFLFDQDKTQDQETNLWQSEGQLSCDVLQDENFIIIKSAIAGVEPKNLDISVSNDLLTIRGWRDIDETIKNEDFYCREIYWGSFSRSIVLPQEVDPNRTEAILKNGILTIKLPKKYKTASIAVKHFDD